MTQFENTPHGRAAILTRPNPNLPDDIEELARLEGRRWKAMNSELRRRGVPQASGGQWYQDARPPWLMADTTSVTLATTMKQLWATADMTPTYASDWWAGKRFCLRAFGRITTPTGAGALTVQLGYGTAEAAGALATSAALTMIASQANISWRFEGTVRCRAIGPGASGGILIASGIFEAGAAVFAAAQAMIPATANAQVTGLNLNQNSGIHLQMAEASTTGGTVIVHDLDLVAAN